MGKFKDKNGHSRWQEGKADVKAFLDRNSDAVGPVLKGIVKVAVPRAAHVLEAIDEVKAAKSNSSAKQKAMDALGQLLEDLDDDDAPAGDSQPSPSASVDYDQLVNSTKVSKFLTPVLICIVSLIFAGMWITEIAHYWGFLPAGVDPMDKATITAVFGSLVGLRQITRSEVKKRIVNQQ